MVDAHGKSATRTDHPVWLTRSVKNLVEGCLLLTG